MSVVIKGKSIRCTEGSRNHYMHGKENENIRVHEVKGFATQDAETALTMVELSAKGTKCQKPLYSVKLNPEPDRPWSKDELHQAIGMLETNLGLTGHPRVVVEHLKKGRVHYHVLWSRFHPDGGPAKKMGNDYAAHQKTQKEIEKAFKLRPMMAKGRDFKQWEVEWAKRYGFDIFKLRDQITADFNKSKGGQQFKASLEAKGIILCRGDKSQFVIILPWGQHKALSSMIMGRPTKAVLRRALGDIDINALPTVQEGKAIVKARLPKLKAKPRGKAGRALRPKTGRGRRSPHAKSWGRYRGSLTSRRAKGAAYPYKSTGGAKTNQARFNQQPIGTTALASTKSNTNTNTNTKTGTGKNAATATNPTSINSNGQGGKTGGIGTTKGITPKAAEQNLGGASNVNPRPEIATGKQNYSAAPASPNQTPHPLPPVVNPFVKNGKTGKDSKPEQPNPAPFRPTGTKVMCEAQRIDLEAALAKKMPWPEYYRKWGYGDGPAP